MADRQATLTPKQFHEMAAKASLDAAILQYDAATYTGDVGRLTAARAEVHDVLDAYLDAKAASFEELRRRFTGGQ